MSGGRWKPYVPVAARKAKALKQLDKQRKKGVEVKPVHIEGRKIARTFWGAAWCDHLESFSDYENRLPRGRTYVRNGSVCHLDISSGTVEAMVSGSSMYTVGISVKPLAEKKWQTLKKQCAGRIGSLLELLQGKLSTQVMAVVTDRRTGLFPLPREIEMHCSCPDWAIMCKHVAAVLYGVGARLDEAPELLFLLRAVDHEELIAADIEAAAAGATDDRGGRRRIADTSISDVFGIDVAEEPPAEHRAARRAARRTKPKAEHPAKPAAKAAAEARNTSGQSAAESSNAPLTGESVRALRSELGMSRTELAELLEVSAASISNWEKQTGVLNLQARSLKALQKAMRRSGS